MSSATAAAHRRLDEAATRATELVQTFATVDDPYSTSDENPWKHPDRIFQQLHAARADLLQAWKDLEQESKALLTDDDNDANKDDADAKKPLDPERCRALYMDMITDAFADTLENMRKTGDGSQLNVDVLVDCLQSGMDLLTNEEQEALFSKAFDQEFDGEDDDNNIMMDEQEEQLTPHEMHRRKMGLDVSVLEKS